MIVGQSSAFAARQWHIERISGVGYVAYKANLGAHRVQFRHQPTLLDALDWVNR